MNKTPLFFALTMLIAAASLVKGDSEVIFEPTHAKHAGAFHVDLPPEKAIWLFTAPGERLWAPGWNPTILSGNGTEAGTVFVTHHGNETTIWVVVDYDTEAFRARYSKTTPGKQAGTVEVNLRPNGKGGSKVEVTYELTALAEAGNKALAHFDAPSYATMMKEWDHHIRHAEAAIAKHFLASRGQP